MKIMLCNTTKMVGDSGGVAKVACAFANEMKHRGHSVAFVYSDGSQGEFFYHMDADIPRYDLYLVNGRTTKLPLSEKIRREVLRIFSDKAARTVNSDFQSKVLPGPLDKVIREVKPDVIVAFDPAVTKLLKLDLHVDIPVVTMSHGDTKDYFERYASRDAEAIQYTDVMQVLVPSYVKPIAKHFPNVRTVVIGNAIPQYNEQANLAAKKDVYKIIFVGRLAKSHKRPHLLIEAFAKLAKDFPNWIVELWGAKQGDAYYKNLQLLISKNNLQSQCFLKGTTNNVPAVLEQADIFVFPSAYEGFGMALAEGMCIGLPAVGYKNCSAVNEIIVDGQNGYLCDDGIDDLANKLQKLMNDKKLRIQMGHQAREDMRQYAPQVIWDKWEKLLMEFKK